MSILVACVALAFVVGVYFWGWNRGVSAMMDNMDDDMLVRMSKKMERQRLNRRQM